MVGKFNLVQTNINYSHLNIETKYQVQTKIVTADFNSDESIYAHIEAEIQDLPVGILGNETQNLF